MGWPVWPPFYFSAGRIGLKARVSSAPLLNPQRVHGRNRCGAVGRNDGGKEGADRQRPRRHTQRKRVPGSDAVKLGGEQASGTNGQWQAEDQANQYALECSTQDESKHLRAVGTKRHANADFVGSLSNGISGYSVEANRGKDQRNNAEQPRETSHGALLVEGKLNLLLHGSDAVDGQVGIQIGKHPGELRFEGARGQVGYEQHSSDKVGVQLDFLHQFVGIIHILG